MVQNISIISINISISNSTIISIQVPSNWPKTSTSAFSIASTPAFKSPVIGPKHHHHYSSPASAFSIIISTSISVQVPSNWPSCHHKMINQLTSNSYRGLGTARWADMGTRRQPSLKPWMKIPNLVFVPPAMSILTKSLSLKKALFLFYLNN